MTSPTIHTEAYWTPWGILYRAHDDNLGADCSPYGEGETAEEAEADLREQLDDME